MTATATKQAPKPEDVECDAWCHGDHCADFSADKCPWGALPADPMPEIQEIFHRHGPADERNCDWFRSTVEPWYSLAGALGVR